MTGEEGGEGEGEGGENCHPLITSLLNEGAVIKRLKDTKNIQRMTPKILQQPSAVMQVLKVSHQ